MAGEIVSRSGINLKLGYIVVVNREDKGYVGGYLCADEQGYPLEFWHTTAVKTDPLQELIYGNTLKPHLFGRNIAGTLLKGRDLPTVLLTEDESLYKGFAEPEVPILLIRRDRNEDDPIQSHTSRTIQTGQAPLIVCWHIEDQETIENVIPRLEEVNLLEPFERIQKVLDELDRASS